MSASVESIIAGVLRGHWTAHTDIAGDDIRFLCECGTVELVKDSGHSSASAWSTAHQAAAVMAALVDAGTVEWGVLTTLGMHVPYDSEEDARTIAAQNGSTPIRRLTLPWLEVEA